MKEKPKPKLEPLVIPPKASEIPPLLGSHRLCNISMKTRVIYLLLNLCKRMKNHDLYHIDLIYKLIGDKSIALIYLNNYDLQIKITRHVKSSDDNAVFYNTMVTVRRISGYPTMDEIFRMDDDDIQDILCLTCQYIADCYTDLLFDADEIFKSRLSATSRTYNDMLSALIDSFCCIDIETDSKEIDYSISDLKKELMTNKISRDIKKMMKRKEAFSNGGRNTTSK